MWSGDHSAYPASSDEEGDPVTLAEARSTTFAHRRKVFMVSTPTIRGLSRIEREYEASDQRRYFVPCPHCGHMQWLQFERLRWDKGRPDTAAYHCEGCETPIAEHHKTQMLERGKWRATAVPADPQSIGFHISALYSPLVAIALVALAVTLFLLNFRKAGERAGRAAERLDILERNNAVQRQMLEAAAGRPRDRDALLERMRNGGF